MEMESSVPPGFRFHPTEEELVGYYLTRKINSEKIDLNVICDIDLYRMEPWDIQGSCKFGYEEQNEWYFFSYKDRKYPTGTRTNRATAAGFWKATGRDKAVVSKDKIIGMRKTLVFYRGRAPNGRKTDWIMHEYRLQNSENEPPREGGWVVCRAFKKPSPGHKQRLEMWNNLYYDSNYRPPSYPSTPMNTKFDHINQNLNGPSNISVTNGVASNEGVVDEEKRNYGNYQHSAYWNNYDKLLASQETTSYAYPRVKLPKLDSPSKNESFEHNSNIGGNNRKYDNDQYENWKNFDELLAPQVSDETSSYAYTNMQPLIHDNDELEWFAEL